ncbi:MAG: hypothetical protein AB7V19_03155, partial [Candidatus Bipolaricaulia bacterium]
SVGCAVVLVRRRSACAAEVNPGARWLGGIWSLPVVLLLGFLAVESVLVPPRDWDGVMTWLPLARMIAHEHTSRPSLLLDAQAWVANPQYPPAIPLLNAVLSPLLGADAADERNLRLLSIGFLCGFLAAVHAIADFLGGRVAARIALAFAMTTQMVMTEPKGGALGEYADLPLAAFLALALLLLIRGTALWSLPLFIASMAMTKMEGLPIAVGLALAVLVFGACADGRRGLPLAALGLGLLLAVGLRIAWQKPIPVRATQEYSLTTLTKTAKVSANVRRTVPLVAARMSPGRRWGALWLLTLTAAVWAARMRRLAPPTRVSLAAACIPLGIGMAAYAAHWNPDRLVAVTWDRFLLQASAPAFALTGVFLAWCVEAARSRREAGEEAATMGSQRAGASRI